MAPDLNMADEKHFGREREEGMLEREWGRGRGREKEAYGEFSFRTKTEISNQIQTLWHFFSKKKRLPF